MSPAGAPVERNLADSFVMEASAGTGKTTELVRRIVQVLAAGAPVEGIAAVTFTNAAAGEMKLRVRHELEARFQTATGPATRQHLARALERLERAFIGTIHAFCASLLRQRPVEAGVDPAFEELSQPQALALFGRVFREWARGRIQAGSPVLARVFARLAWLEDRNADPLAHIQRAAWNLAEWRDYPALWQRGEFQREAAIERLLGEVAGVSQLLDRCARPGRDPLHRSLAPLADLLDRVERRRIAAGPDYDSWEAELLGLPRLLRYVSEGYGAYAPNLSRAQVMAAWEALKGEIRAFGGHADADLAAALRDELWELVPLYEQAKQRRAQLDFLDLLIGARRLLENAEARCAFQARFRHVFVDEFQDTDSLQSQILLTLAGDDRGRSVSGKLFVVGDPKQSIYRFRRADVEQYGRVRDALVAAGVREEKLAASRRSLRSIQDFVNAAFAPHMPSYLALEGGRDPVSTQPAIVALPMPYPFGSRNLSKARINACSPNTVASFVAWLCQESGWTVTERSDPDRRVPIEPRHICILFRRFTSLGADQTQEYVRCLEARGIPHVLVGSKAFHQREEIGALRTALRAIEWPDDELSVFATLKAFSGIPDGTLLKFRATFGRLHPFKPLPADRDAEFATAEQMLAMLAELHRRRNYRPFAGTVRHLLEFTRAHAAFVFRKGGKRVLANVQRLADLAREFEAAGATSFRSFVEYLEAESERAEAGEAPILEQEGGGVKLMTVHRAKGLEFPVVILADLTAHLTGEAGDRYIDHERGLCAQKLLGWAPQELLDHAGEEAEADRAEAVRVAYVAATRARDLLVVSAVGERGFYDGIGQESWLWPLYPALFPAADLWTASRQPDGCPRFRDRTVLERPEGDEGESVRPGLHAGREGGRDVVWFDPAALDLKERKDLGLANEELLSPSAEHAEAGLRRYEEWKSRRAELVRGGSQPRFEIVRAAGAAGPPFSGISVERISLPPAQQRPRGRSFGKLVHAILEIVSFAPGSAAVESAARVCARELGATEEETRAAVDVVDSVLGHDLIREAASAKRMHRELPVLVNQGDGRLVEGRVDLAFCDGTRWTVVDFKTGPADRGRDERQLQLYALALERAAGLPVRAVLFEV
jgi:ATP-dependent exoDNAse (exonuclease V) beta subunit